MNIPDLDLSDRTLANIKKYEGLGFHIIFGADSLPPIKCSYRFEMKKLCWGTHPNTIWAIKEKENTQ